MVLGSKVDQKAIIFAKKLKIVIPGITNVRRLAAFFEGLNSSLAQLAGKLWWCKLAQK